MSKKILTNEQVLYCREHYIAGDAAFGMLALAKKFGVSRDTIKDVVHGETYRDVGGTIHAPLKKKPAEVKAAILAEYVPRSPEANVAALAKKYNMSQTTVLKILHDGGYAKGQRGVVTPEIKQEILATYVPYSDTYGRSALAAKFGLSSSAVGNILKELPEERRRAQKSEPTTRGRHKVEIDDETKEAIIIAYDEEKLSVRALADKFALNRLKIREVLTEAGIEVRTRQIVDDDTKREIISEYVAGRSLRDLAESYGVNRATITDWVAGLKPEKPKQAELDDLTREQVLRFHSRGYGVSPIAKSLNLPQSLVRKIINGEI